MYKFLETCNLPRLNHEELENLNRPITSNETELVFPPSPHKSPDLGGFTGDSAKHLKKFNTNPSQIIQKNENKIEE